MIDSSQDISKLSSVALKKYKNICAEGAAISIHLQNETGTNDEHVLHFSLVFMLLIVCVCLPCGLFDVGKRDLL